MKKNVISILTHKLICVLFRTIYAFDYDEEAGAISNRRIAVKNDPSLGVSYSVHVAAK